MMENEKPLTMSDLINYNQKVLLPVFENRFSLVENRLGNVENKLGDIMLSFDHVFKKLDILIEDKW